MLSGGSHGAACTRGSSTWLGPASVATTPHSRVHPVLLAKPLSSHFLCPRIYFNKPLICNPAQGIRPTKPLARKGIYSRLLYITKVPEPRMPWGMTERTYLSHNVLGETCFQVLHSGSYQEVVPTFKIQFIMGCVGL